MRINVKKGVRKIELTRREHTVLSEAKYILVELAKQQEGPSLSDDADIAADKIGEVQRALGANMLTLQEQPA